MIFSFCENLKPKTLYGVKSEFIYQMLHWYFLSFSEWKHIFSLFLIAVINLVRCKSYTSHFYNQKNCFYIKYEKNLIGLDRIKQLKQLCLQKPA